MTKYIKCVIIYTALKQAIMPKIKDHSMKTTGLTVTLCTIFCLFLVAALVAQFVTGNEELVRMLTNLTFIFGFPATVALVYYLKKTATR